VGNENSDVGLIKHSIGPNVPHPSADQDLREGVQEVHRTLVRYVLGAERMKVYARYVFL